MLGYSIPTMIFQFPRNNWLLHTQKLAMECWQLKSSFHPAKPSAVLKHPTSYLELLWDRVYHLYQFPHSVKHAHIPKKHQKYRKKTHLRYFQKLSDPIHAHQKLLVNIESIFTLLFIHIKIFFCNKQFLQFFLPNSVPSYYVLPNKLIIPSL